MQKIINKIPKLLDDIKSMTAVMMIFTAIFISIFHIIVNINTNDSNIKLENRFNKLSVGWDIEYSDGSVESSKVLPYWIKIEPDESITLVRTIPHYYDHYNSIVTRNYHQRLKIYINNSIVYTFPKPGTVTSTSIITDDWNLIHFKEGVRGQEVRIKFQTDNQGFEGYIDAPFIGEDNAIIGYLRSKYALPYVLSYSIALLGLLILTVASIFTKHVLDRGQALLALVFICAGIWFSDRSKMPVFVVGSNIKFFLAFLCLLMISVLLFLHMDIRFKNQNKTVINTLSFLDAFFLITLFILVASNTYSVHHIIKYVYLSILITCLYFVFLLCQTAFGKGSKSLSLVEQNATKIEFYAAVATIVLSLLSILWDAISSNNWNTSQRDWSGVGNLQMIAINVFALAQLIIVLYRGYHGTLEREVMNKKLHDSQLELMMGQIQPHFIFNTLSSIRTLIKIDPEVAYDMVYDFSNYLRANVDNITNLDGIKFSSEVDHIKSYVGIELVRFGNRLNVEYDIQESNFTVPPLSIQPLVENAIKHGVCKRIEGGTVWLKSYSDANSFIVEIKDDGVGIEPERLKQILSYESSYTDLSNTDKANETLKQTLDISLIRDDSGKLMHLEDVPLPAVNPIGNGSEAHVSTGLKNIILRLKEISNATVEITSQVNHGTTMRVFFPKDYNQPV